MKKILMTVVAALTAAWCFGVEHDELDDCAAQPAPIPVQLGDLKWKLPKEASLNGDRLVVDVPESAGPRSAMATADVDLSGRQGHSIQISVQTKGVGVRQPKVPYHGFKFQLQIEYADGAKDWPAGGGGSGEWEEARTIKVTLHDKPIRRVQLQLGIQQSTGRAEFDLSTLKAVDTGKLFSVVNRDHRCVYTDDVKNAPRRRGVMLPTRGAEITEDHFATLGRWGATLARYQMAVGWSKTDAWLDPAEYDRYIDGELEILEKKVLPWAEKHGLQICIDMHAAPGARVGAQKELRMCFEQKYADQFVETWRKIARRFRGDRRVYGFDLVNEPVQKGAAPHSYLHLQLAAARAIREIDPKTPIIIESNEYDSPSAFAYLSPLKLENIIYQAHCYKPMDFTHQGTHGKPKTGLFGYPNAEKGWNKEFIRKSLQPVRDFELKHGAKIYIGEFSAATWAPGAENYIRDAIEIFEEYGWDWSYHAFRESKMWSVEHTWRQDAKGRDVFAPSADNPRMRALREGFSPDPLDAFWSSTKGAEMTRLPLSVVPVNAFDSLSNVKFEQPTPVIENRIVDAFAAKSVYNVVTLTLRSKPDLSDAITMERVKNYIDRCHAAGIKVLMDIDARIARREFLKRYPADCASVICVTKDENLSFPSYRDHMAWGAERGYDAVAKKVLKKLPNGLMLVQFDLFAVDPATPKLTPFLEELALRYKELGADGAMRDEWGFPPIRDFHKDHAAFPYSPAFAAEYARVSGGRDYIADLAEIASGTPAAREAIDFMMRTIYGVCVRTEKEFYDLNYRLFGKDVYVTKHPTWHCRFDASEFMHNGLDWWGVARDWAQSDETIPLPCISGMARKCGGPCWMNEGYGPNPEHYGFAVWRYALCGGRMVYHGIYGGNSSIKRLYTDPMDMAVHGSGDILTPGNVRAQARVNLLNLISRAQVDVPVAFVFGHSRALNWLDPAYQDDGLALAYALGKQGRYVDEYPSSQFAEGTFSVDGDGYLKVGGQRYEALVLYRLSAADVADFAKVLSRCELKTPIFVWDTETKALKGVMVTQLASATDAAPILAHLDKIGAVRQTPLADYGLDWNSGDKLPYPDGTVTLLDGTKARIRGSMPHMEGDRIGGGDCPLVFGDKKVFFDAVGVFAARLDAKGELEAVAAGGLKSMSGSGLKLNLSGEDDVALVKKDGKWRGFWQTTKVKAEVPSALKKLTDDWRVLRLPRE